ncbi:hypothetical protein HK105_206787 [Polyrhizophydium stewartii]|uniref:Uncharacterized protein n=1 Tax=Polyrhizophydium stewartii TaxID=2732419 RepID=A0ABR4N2T2_9FUNG
MRWDKINQRPVTEAVLRLGWRTCACIDTTTTKSIWFQDHEPQAANRVGLDTWVFQAPLGALEAAAGATDSTAVHAGIPVPPANAMSVMCLAIRGSSLLRLAAGSISELALLIETVIAASWPRGSSRPKSAQVGRVVDFQLHSTPWYWAEAGELEGRLFVLRMLSVLAAIGWHIVALVILQPIVAPIAMEKTVIRNRHKTGIANRRHACSFVK